MNNDINVPNTNNNYDNQFNSPNVNYNQQFNDNGYVPNIPNNNNKKNNTTLIIIIVVLSILAVFVGTGIMVATTIFKTIDSAVKDVEERVEFDESEELTTTVYDFSEYKNYKFKMKMIIGTNGIEVSTLSDGIADVKNGTDYMVTTATTEGYSSTSYSYSDYNEGFSYTSDDKTIWVRDEISGTESINLSDIIDKINQEDDDVTVLGDNHYSVKVDFEDEDISYNGVYADVYVTNGYISKLSYDLTSVVASEGFSKFIIDIQLSDFNKAGDVVIPEDVKKVHNSI